MNLLGCPLKGSSIVQKIHIIADGNVIILFVEIGRPYNAAISHRACNAAGILTHSTIIVKMPI